MQHDTTLWTYINIPLFQYELYFANHEIGVKKENNNILRNTYYNQIFYNHPRICTV